jgi:shikimate kinase
MSSHKNIPKKRNIQNVVLIGMPGSGKSTIGKLLSRMMNFNFLDCDYYIEKTESQTLQQIIDSKGVKEFKKIEEARILELNVQNFIIAPGGSVVYYPRAIKHLKKTSILVFLNVAFFKIQARLKNASTRGIVGLKKKTIYQLYNERRPLYLKHADLIINCTRKTKYMIAREIYQRVINFFTL